MDFDNLKSTARPKPKAPVLNKRELETSSLTRIRNYIIHERLQKKYDAVIALCGHEGSGKSTFAVKIAKMLDPNFSIKRNLIAYPTYEKMAEAIKGLPKGAAIIADEAMLTLYKRQSMSTNVIKMNALLGICRKYGKILIYIMPRFEDFDERMREHRIALWIECVERGLALVMFPNPVRIKSGRWELDKLYSALESIRKGKRNYAIGPKMIARAYRKHPAYLGMVTWTAMNPQDEIDYLQLVAASEPTIGDLEEEKKHALQVRYESQELSLGRAVEMLIGELGVKKKDVRDVLSLSYPQIKRLRAISIQKPRP